MPLNDFTFFNRGGDAPPPKQPIDAEQVEANKILMRGVRNRVIILAVIIVALVLIWQCVVITKPNEYIVTRQFGEIMNITTEPGVSLKVPFIQTTSSVPNNIQLYDIPISDVITQDKKTMVADSFVLWRVSDPTAFIRTLSGNVQSAESRIGNNLLQLHEKRHQPPAPDGDHQRTRHPGRQNLREHWRVVGCLRRGHDRH